MRVAQPRAARAVCGLIVAALLMPFTTSPSAAWTCDAQDKHVLEATQPIDIGQLKLQLRDYRYCGRYDADFADKIGEAMAYVQQRVPQVARPALVLDIDETSLSNWLEIDQDDFAFIPSGACILQPGFTCGELQWEPQRARRSTQADAQSVQRRKVLGSGHLLRDRPPGSVRPARCDGDEPQACRLRRLRGSYYAADRVRRIGYRLQILCAQGYSGTWVQDHCQYRRSAERS